MLAMHSGLTVRYDVAWTALSILVAGAFALAGFDIMHRTGSRWLGGAVAGLGAGAMHFAGMQAMEGAFHLSWNTDLTVTSLAVGVALCALAMQAQTFGSPRTGRILAALLFTLGIGGLHFTGMMAAKLVPDARIPSPGHHFPPEALAVVVVAVSLLIVFVGLSSAYLDLYLEKRRTDESVRLRAHIAELEATKRELGLALETASAANKTKSTFLAAMSHELRTPLNAIIGFSELMRAEAFGPLGDVRYRTYSEDICTSGNHLLRLINDILDLSRLEARKAELHEAPVLLPRLMQEARAMLENQARDAHVSLVHECAPDLPLIRADERRVKQIVLNLLSNAIKFTPAGGRVRLSAKLNAGTVEIVVADTGIGIAKSDLAKAFESFGQIDNRLSRRYEGSGLGLPLARHLAELHGASLSIDSQPSMGTVVTVRFPASRCLPLDDEMVA
jgi:signal transduction histidine kinase